jgi:hypothetical protein
MKRVNSVRSITSNGSNNEHTRDQIRKQLIEAFDLQDSVNEVKFTIAQVAENIEREVFEICDNDCKSKAYRDKCKKIIMRLKGKRNKHLRQLIREGLLDIAGLCKMNDEQLDDEKHFTKIERGTCKVPRSKSIILKRIENELTLNVYML